MTNTDTLIAADGTEITGTYYAEPALFRAEGDTPADGLFVVHYSDVDGRLLLRRDIYPVEVLATLNPRTSVPAWTEAVAEARAIVAAR